MWHQLVEALSAALFAMALIGLEKVLPFHEPYNILVAGAVGVVGFALLFIIYWQFRHSRLLRKLTDDLHTFEGDWLEEWSDGNKPRYSLATIRFNTKTKQYRLDGKSYDKNGKQLAWWGSNYLFYDGPSSRLVHVWDGVHKGRPTSGATFFYVDLIDSQSGRGFFIDERPEGPKHFDVSYERLLDPTGLNPWQKKRKDWIKQRHATAQRRAR